MPDPIWPTTAFRRLLHRRSLRVGATSERAMRLAVSDTIRQWEDPIWPTTAFCRLLHQRGVRVGATSERATRLAISDTIRQWEEQHA